MNRIGRLAVPLLAILLLSMLTPIISIGSEAESEPLRPAESMLIDIRLDGPEVIGSGLEETFTLRISYAYPERIDNYTYVAEIVETAVGGKVTPINATSHSGVFEVKIRGMDTAGKMTVKVNATANEIAPVGSWAGTTWYRVKEFEVEVVKPIFVEAILVNTGDATVNNVSVKMLIDGDLKRTEHYNLSANQTISLNFSWVTPSIDEGKHTVTLLVNDPANIIDFSSGDNILTIDIYYSKSGNILRGILAIMIIFVAIILVLTYLQKKPSTKGK